jgi:hypothetical protein
MTPFELLAGLFILVGYFLPALVAAIRGHKNTLAIFVSSVFLNWTGLGWIVNLIWSCTATGEHYNDQ